MTNKISNLAEYFEKYQESVADPEGFWSKIADSHYWHKKWDKVLDWYFEYHRKYFREESFPPQRSAGDHLGTQRP